MGWTSDFNSENPKVGLYLMDLREILKKDMGGKIEFSLRREKAKGLGKFTLLKSKRNEGLCRKKVTKYETPNLNVLRKILYGRKGKKSCFPKTLTLQGRS